MRLIRNSQKMRFRGYSVRSVMPLLLFVILVICAFSLHFFSSVARIYQFCLLYHIIPFLSILRNEASRIKIIFLTSFSRI